MARAEVPGSGAMGGADLPTGTVTFLFTDIEGSTMLLRRLGGRYPEVLAEHHRILLEAVSGVGGHRVSTEGDAVFAVFDAAARGVAAAIEAQRALAAHRWPAGIGLRVRMGLHTGEGTVSRDTYVGLDVHRAARISAAANGGQLIVSAATAALVEHALPQGVELRDLGEHRLKDLEHPERLWQVVIPGLPDDFPPPSSLSARPNNLPPVPTSFIGRTKELAEIKDLLAGTRLLTLTGPGGTGKTRLSLEAASAALPGFQDGAFFVPLAAITDPALVPSSIALALGVKESGEANVVDMVRGHLRSRDLLLILDNFEQVVDAGPLVSELLRAAPSLRVIVTSREVLHLYGEQEYPVPPLRLPEVHRLPSPELLSQYDAVALFIQRARAVDPSFQVTNDNAPAIAEICVRLDGLPLAIELAAARVKMLPPEALLRRLDDRLSVLRGGARDLPARQQTLRDAIAWSYDLLDPPEQILFRRLGVFMGGGTYEAAEVVAGDDVGIAVLEGVEALIDKSLLRRANPGPGGPRAWMLETIREYAMERLAESGDGSGVEARHAAFFVALAEEAELHLTSERQAEWLDRIEREHDNLRSVLGRSIRAEEAETALRVGGDLWRFWHLRGHLTEGREWLSRILALPSAAPPTTLRAKALVALAGLTYWQSDYAPAAAAYAEALAIYRESDDSRGLMNTLYGLAYIRAIEGKLEEADDLAAASGRIAESIGDRKGIGFARHMRGAVSYYRGQSGEALSHGLEAVRVFREVGERFGLANSLHMLAGIRRLQGEHAAARAAALDSLRMFRDAGNVSGVAMALGGIAALMIAEGDAEDGVRLGGAAHAMEETISGRAPVALRGYEDARDIAAPLLGQEAAARAWEEGHGMSMDDAVEMALRGPGASGGEAGAGPRG